MRILAGDIGGTNTRLSIWEREGESLRRVGEPAKFKNAPAESLASILQQYLQTAGDGVTDACFGIAGPVDGRTVRLTNIPHWPAVVADDLCKQLDVPELHRVNLINDMPAHSASLASILRDAPAEAITVHAGTARATGTRAIVMPGTGLGIGMLVWEPHGAVHKPVPTEAGHQDLPARDETCERLVRSMRKVLGAGKNVTREHIISGPGLRAIYACLKNPESPDVDAAPKPEEIQARESHDETARQTLDLFARLLGELCGNAAFGCLATGGIFLAGSICNSLRARIASGLFVDAFTQTGPPALRGLISSVPVTLVTYADTGLLGAATYAMWAADRRL